MKIVATLVLGLFVLTQGKLANADDAHDTAVAQAVKDYVDRGTGQGKGKVIFLGSSTMSRWDDGRLQTDFPSSHHLFAGFPGFPVFSRGIPNSKIADTTKYAKELVWEHKPKAIVFYAGENDIALGASPETVKNHFISFVDKMREDQGGLGTIPISYISIKPSPEFLQNTPQSKMWKANVLKANTLIYKHIKSQPATAQLYFIDVWRPMTDREGKGLSQYFNQGEARHINNTGYDLWAVLTRPYIHKMLKAATP